MAAGITFEQFLRDHPLELISIGYLVNKDGDLLMTIHSPSDGILHFIVSGNRVAMLDTRLGEKCLETGREDLRAA